jgi:hypothetical protein
VIAVWWNAERSLERAAKIVGAQTNKPRQLSERDGFGEVFFHIAGDDALLPSSKPPSRQWFAP